METPQTIDDLDNLSDEELMGVSDIPAVDPTPVEDPVVVPDPEPVVEDPSSAPQLELEEEAEGGILEPLEEGEHDGSQSLEDILDAKAAADETEDTTEAPSGEDTLEASEDPNASSDATPLDPNHTTPKQSTEDDSANADPNSANPDPEKEAPVQALDKSAAYDQIMAPFKANGRQIKLSSPEEAVRLMQQGANYTRKMQHLKPNLKMMRMLENNGLLDEEKLGFMIDVHRKDPAAIAKLVKESGVDVLDIDTDTPPAYEPGNHTVSDNEMSFSDALGDVMSNPEGKETVNVINSQWDQASKEQIFKEPNILQIITDQRGNGIYDQISAEIDKQKMIGTLDPATPFIQAYKTVGDQLHQQGKLVTQTVTEPEVAPQVPQPQSSPTPAPARVLGQRTSTVRRQNTADADPRVRAAAPTKSSTPKPKQGNYNVFELSDEEIMKM